MQLRPRIWFVAADRRAVASSGYGLGAEVRAATSTAASPLRGRARAVLEQLVPTSSRLILHLSRLKIAVPTANLVRWRALSSSGWGRALKRAATPSAGSRAAWSLVGGEERLVPTSSRILFHLSRLMVAVPAANLVGWRAAASSGYGWALERAATSTAAFPLCGRSWAARSGLCRPPPGYFSTFTG